MIAIPAVDLREGACVQLVGGSYSDERVRLDDPIDVALRWEAVGFTRLHLVDLDAATDAGSNAKVVDEVLRVTRMEVQVGGGIRSAERVDALFDAGAARVVVGTRALEDPRWIAEQSARYPGRVIVAADVRDHALLVRGWQATASGKLLDTVRTLSNLPLAGVLVTDVGVEGTMRGPSLGLIQSVVAVSTRPVIASGGIGTIEDVHALAAQGAAAAVLGMAIYTGSIDPRELASHFATRTQLA